MEINESVADGDSQVSVTAFLTMLCKDQGFEKFVCRMYDKSSDINDVGEMR